ncbi:MAG: membrane protein insertase YidC [Candidatus Halalkalibacterium sp. M3_1C_030]
MDRNTVTGLVLILLTMVAWAYFTMPSEEELQRRQAEQQARQDSIAAVQRADSIAQAQQQDQTATTGDEIRAVDEESSQMDTITEDSGNGLPEMGIFGNASIQDTSSFIVNTPYYRATFTNLGAGPSQILLKDYETWDHQPVEMIKDTTESTYTLGFLSSENYNIETDKLVFEQLTQGDSLSLAEGETAELQYALNINDNKRILYTYTLNGNSHEIDLSIKFEGLERDIIGSSVEFGWESPLQFTEKDPTQDGYYTSAYVYTGGEMEQLLLSEPNREEKNYNGTIDWVATRTKFFTQVIKSETPTEGALLVGELSGQTDNPNTDYRYQSYISADIPEDGVVEFQLYTGPLSYNLLKQFDETAYDMVDVGYSWTRWFSDPLVRFLIIPYFGFVADYMNVGLAIILFAVLIKLVLYPLTKKSYKSMAAMKELQPKMKEIQDKYSDDPQKQQKATMKLYKEAGVNPLGGCLPNLLQLPILITLWRFFQNSILIRQEEFLWAADLSAPDYILSLPFSIPFIGDQLAGFVLLMSVAMVFQSRLTGGMGGPGGGGGAPGGINMKAMQYIFPVMMLFIFNNFAAGLSLYYLIYNVVSIGQQLLIYRQMDNEKAAAEA